MKSSKKKLFKKKFKQRKNQKGRKKVMMSLIRNRTLTSIRNILIAGSIFFIGCEDITYSGEGEPYVMFEWDARLPIDENGYYHLIMDRDNHQTLHRISGMVTDNGEPIQNVRVTWESDLYWVAYIDGELSEVFSIVLD
jgi:hypothetical protein